MWQLCRPRISTSPSIGTPHCRHGPFSSLTPVCDGRMAGKEYPSRTMLCMRPCMSESSSTTCFVLNGLDRVMYFHCACPCNGISELVVERIASWIVRNLGKRMEIEFSDYVCSPADIADLDKQVHAFHAWDTYSHNGSVQRIGFPCGCDECEREYEDSGDADNLYYT